MVGLTGFEPAASSSRTRRATKLRHSPTFARVETLTSNASIPEPAEPLEIDPPGGPASPQLRGTSVISVASGRQATRTRT
jgi:hypothetical protein